MYESEELWRAKSGQRQSSGGHLLGWLARVLLLFCVAGGGAVWLLSNRGEVVDGVREASARHDERPARGAGQEGVRWDEVDNELVLRKGPNGHFLVKAHVNGVETRFLVDTGASDVALTKEDALRIGINAGRLKYTRKYQTANGVIRAAPIKLRDVRIGQLRVQNVEATVSEAPMGISLLGMSFLGELAGYEVRGDRLILRW